MKKVVLRGILGVGALAVAGFFYVSYQTSHSQGKEKAERVVRIESGESAVEIAEKLEAEGIIAWHGYFVYHVVKEDLRHKIVAGEYVLSGAFTVPEIARIVTRGEVVPQEITVTFPEGWEMKKMAERLEARGLPGQVFLERAKQPLPEWRTRFEFLQSSPADASLEGFLFPDTYTFAKDVSAEEIIVSMLENFDKKISEAMYVEMAKQNRTLFEVVTLASIVETEVQNTADRKQVADLFWRRLAIGQPLQSDATVKYILGKNKIQHSIEETRVASPYNTYVNKGLPPGPISNPGLDSLEATVFPAPNPYYYFLSDPETGETVFGTTFEEHKVNKERHGL
jgi:UPF0755 protein